MCDCAQVRCHQEKRLRGGVLARPRVWCHEPRRERNTGARGANVALTY